MKKLALFSKILFGIGLSLVYFDFESIWAKVATDCDKKLLQKPTEYKKGSELYYLSWIENGEYGEKEIAAKRLFELGKLIEIEKAEHLCLCEKEQVVKNYLILTLFEVKPTKYLKQTQNLLTEKDISGLQPNLEATWVKAGKFEDEDVDFYFDWGKESALKLLSKGYISDKSIEILIQIANSFYSSDRKHAQRIFPLFEGIPTIDLTQQRERYDGENPFQLQLNEIEVWFQKNKNNIVWSEQKQKYLLK